MKIKVFDVVELNDCNKATILSEESKGIYKAEIVSNNGKTKEIKSVEEKDINKIIFSK